MAKKPMKISVDEFLSTRKDFVGSNGAITKATKSPASWDSVNRSARFVMSTEAPDRDKDIVVQSGIDLTEFLKNPQALLFHSSWNFPIGLWEDVQSVAGRPKRTEGTLKFVPAGKDKEADLAAFHVENSSLRAVSIGFIPKSVRRREENPVDGGWPGYEILECELVECSLVPIPANPGALVKSAARDLKMGRDLIEEILDTWVKLPTGLIAPRKDYENALSALSGFKSSAVVEQKATADEKDGGDEDADNSGTPGARDDDEDDNPPRTAGEDKGADTDGDAETSDDEPDADDEKSAVGRVLAKIGTMIDEMAKRFSGRHEPPQPAPADPEQLAKSLARFQALQAETQRRLG